MSTEQRRLVSELERIFRTTHAPVRTVALAQRCYMSERWTLYKLVELEKIGAVQRVGQRRGWMLPEVA